MTREQYEHLLSMTVEPLLCSSTRCKNCILYLTQKCVVDTYYGLIHTTRLQRRRYAEEILNNLSEEELFEILV